MSDEYAIGDSVVIRAIESRGFVDALMRDGAGVQYRVVYWHADERKSVWMYAREIGRADEILRGLAVGLREKNESTPH